MTQARLDSEISDAASTRHAWYIVILLMCAFTLSMLDRMILSLLIEPIQRDLRISDTEFGLLQGFAFVLIYSVAGLPIGWLVDRTSRKAIVACGITLWSGMTMSSAFASNFAYLSIARMGVGIGEASLSPAAYSMMGDMFSREKLSRAVSIYLIGAMVGSGLAFLFGGAVVGILSGRPHIILPILGEMRMWQTAFLVAGAPGLLIAALMLTVCEPPRAAKRASEGTPGTTIFRFLRERWRLLTLILFGITFQNLCLLAMMSWLPAMLMRKFDLAPGHVGLALGLSAGVAGLSGYIMGSVFSERWIRRGRLDANMRVSMLAMATALPLALVTTLSGNLVITLGFMFATFFAVCMPGATAWAGLQLVTPPLLRGQCTAMVNLPSTAIAAGLGPLLVALFTDYIFARKSAVDLSLAFVMAIFLPLSAICYNRAMARFAETVYFEGGGATPPGVAEESPSAPLPTSA